MAIGIRFLSNNLSGETASVTFLPSTGGTINVGTQTIPFNYIAEFLYGTYNITVDTYGYTYEVEVTEPASTPTPTPTTTVSSTPTLTPTNTVTPSISTTPGATITITPTTTVTPSVTPSISLTPTITSTVSTTPSVTPSISLSPTVTPSISATPSVTPSISATPSVTPSISLSPSYTPTNTVTPTLTPSISLTPTPTPSQSAGGPAKALIFMESQDDVNFTGPEDTDLGTYMLNNAVNDWYGFWTSGVGGINATDLNIYMNWPGFFSGTTNVPAVIEVDVPQSGGGTDSFGNAIEAYKFETAEISGGTTTGNVWYSIFVPPSLTNNQVYSNIGVNYSNSPTSLLTVNTEPTIYTYNISYSGAFWSNTTYKAYTQSATGGGFNQGSTGVVDNTNNYFRGGTLV